MKKQSIWILGLFGLAILLAACGSGGGDTSETAQVPADYAGKTNPHAGDAAVADQGAALYSTNCASCHGDSGKGDTPAGQALDPKAADLTADGDQADDFVYWRIAEGGLVDPFNSSMPAWKNLLSEDEIWQVITYIRTLQ
jgi:mono/diheme cytochrome c family protein